MNFLLRLEVLLPVSYLCCSTRLRSGRFFGPWRVITNEQNAAQSTVVFYPWAMER